MQKISYRERNILILIFFLIIISYFAGFLLNENSAGGAEVDFENVKRNILTFKNNSFIDAIKSTATNDPEIFQSTRAPAFYVFNKYFNPFTTQVRFFQFFITILSLLIPLFFFLSLKLKFKDTNKYILLLISSCVLLSPYLRSSAFWGIEENFGIIILSVTTFFYQLFIKSKDKEILNLFFLAIFSSLCVYSDQKLILIPLIILINILYLERKTYLKFLLIILYVILSIPFLYLIKLWGGIVPSGDAVRRAINIISFKLNYHYFLYSLSIIAFYLFPIYLFKINYINFNFQTSYQSKINNYFSIIFLIFLIYFLFFFNLSSMYYLGGGVFQKLTNSIISDNLLLKKTILSIIFIFSWLIILKFISNKFLNYVTILSLPFFSIIISPALFQEYFDPLIFFLIFFYTKNKIKLTFKNSIVYFIYFFIFWFTSIIYYNYFTCGAYCFKN